MKRTTIVLDEWEQALADAMGTREDVVPKEFITVKAFAEKIGRSIPTASRSMSLLMASGAAQKQLFRIQVGNVFRPVPHYKLKK